LAGAEAQLILLTLSARLNSLLKNAESQAKIAKCIPQGLNVVSQDVVYIELARW
jgi:hypothetical protein